MPNSTCRLLSNGYKFDFEGSDIVYKPCCHFPMSQRLDASAAEHQEFRRNLNEINSYKSPTCGQCNFESNRNIRKTWRDHSFKIVPVDAEVGDPSYLEIQTDKTCNGGCIICGPWNSSYWQSELKQFPIKQTVDPIDKILSLIDIQKTKKILFLGGEPFLSTTDTKILPLIKQPELVSLQYTTNGSIYPSQLHIDLWSKFQSVLINFSLDGIGTRFDYIRYPLKWSQVEKNVTRMMKELPGNVQFKSNHTINMLNLYYYKEFDDWHSQVMQSDRNIGYSFTPCDGILSPKTVPKKLFNMLLDKYDVDSKVIQTILDDNCNDQKNLITYLSELDDRRGLNWRHVFPEISDCFV